MSAVLICAVLALALFAVLIAFLRSGRFFGALFSSAVQGAVSLLKETGWHPEAAIDKVTTPGGVTIKGLNELDHSGFNSAVIRSLKAGLK